MSTPALRTLDEIVAELSQPIPDNYLSTKKKGGQELTIFTWITAQRFLEAYAPGWHGDAVLTYSGERVGCVYKLCIPTSDYGLVCRAASGDDQEDDEDETEQEKRQRQFGTPTTRAEGQAFKRAAARFGFGLYLRDKKAAPGGPSSADVPRQVRQVPSEDAEREKLMDRLLVHFRKLGLAGEERGQIFSAIANKPSRELNVTALRIATEQVEKVPTRQAAIDLIDRHSSEKRSQPSPPSPPSQPTPIRRMNA